ncbi:septum site-determining protein Ssd [Catenulispora subtropica]|uniref:Rv3660c-like CheY-like N-terminal domain-containing protein n=1 Tax=Catenulispora subtropica TaxID=450798 RepID=A0ABP5CAZ6_9ACTN
MPLDPAFLGPPPADPDPATAPPLVVTSDPALVRALARIAAEAGVRIEVVPHPGAARRRWAAAPLVLVGADQAGAVARAGLPHRPEVALVGRDLDDATVWRRGTAVGAAYVLILPDCARWLAGMLAEADSPRGEPGALVAVLSGRGGAGGSTLAAALALAGTRRGLRATLVDLDPAGGGIDLLFGLETEPGPRWSELARWRDGRLCGRSLREALPTYAARSRHGLAAGLGFTEEGADRLPVLAWPRADRTAASAPAADPTAGPSADPAGWPTAHPSGIADLWYDSGTPADPEKVDPWLGMETGHPFESADRDEAGNPLYGTGSPAADDELRCGGTAAMSGETQRPDSDDSPIDADPSRESFSRSGVIPLYQGSDSQPGADLAHGRGPAAGPSADRPLPTAGLPVLTWPRTRTDLALPAVGAEPVRAVLGALAQAGDLVVVDLPRTLDEAATEALALATTALIVVPAEVRASAAASQLAAAVRLVTPDLRVVVRLPAPGGLEPLDITDVMGGLPLAGVIGPDRRLSAAAEHGEPPGSSARGSVSAFCRAFLDDLFGAPAGRRGAESRAAA